MNDPGLEVGAQGEAVSRLHEALGQAGYRIPQGEATRRFFGPGTRDAIRRYQQDHALPVNGAADPATLTSLAASSPPHPAGVTGAQAVPAARRGPVPPSQTEPDDQGLQEQKDHLMSDAVVVIKSGEVVHFPVTSDHPLAKYQQQLDSSQLSNLHDLAIVRTMVQANPRLSTDQITMAVNGILASSNIRTILQLGFPDLTVEEGATMVLAGPISTLTAGNVVVLGDILAYGALNLSCSTLGGIAPPVISGISPSTGSTLGGTEVYIQGSGFGSATAVYFGNTPAASARPVDGGLAGFVAYSPPANAGPVDITARVGLLTSAISPADVFTYVYLPGAGSINVSSNVLWAGETITGTVTLDEPAGPEGVTVTMDIPDPAGVTVPASVVINPGETSATFPITASATVSGGPGVEGPGVAGAAIVYASGPDGTEIESPLIEVYAGQIVVILPSALLTGPGLVSGETATGTIVVRTPAPASGGLITLSASHAGAVSIPASVPLPGGGTSATFTLTALQVSGTFGVTISASYEGNSSTSPLFKVIAHEPPPRPPVPPPPPPPPKNGPKPV